MISPTETLSAAVTRAKNSTFSTKHHGGLDAATAAAASAERGVMQRLFFDLFRRMYEKREKDENVTSTAEASILEILCDKVRDLLAVTAPLPLRTIPATSMHQPLPAGHCSSASAPNKLRTWRGFHT
jgi:hypothetical protein